MLALELIKSRLDRIDLNEDMSINSNLGPLCDLKAMTNLSGITQCKSYIEDLAKTFSYARKALNDGNSFYRAFMFALLEQYIITRNLCELDNFIITFNELLGVAFKSHDVVIDKENVLHILYIIKRHIESNDIISAYHTFLKSYLEFPNFDLVS